MTNNYGGAMSSQNSIMQIAQHEVSVPNSEGNRDVVFDEVKKLLIKVCS